MKPSDNPMKFSIVCLFQTVIAASIPFSAAVLCTVLAGASRSEAGVLAGSATDAPNNDDYSGPFGEVNFRGFGNFVGFENDQLFVVEPSGGTTEYSITLTGTFTSAPADSIQLELGFGVGDGFVSAASVLPELDFDAPVPGTPAPTSDVFATVNHQPHRIEYSDGLADDLLYGVAKFTVDVPDLPLSVNDYYAPEELPSDLPPGAAVFTLRKLSSGMPIVPMLTSPFDADYSMTELGTVPGVSTEYGAYAGLTFKPGDSQTLLIAGNANDEQGALFAVEVIRDAGNHIVGFSGEATRYADAPFVDGGVQAGPGGVLFLARWPNNELGQTKPGSSVTDKVISLEEVGVFGSGSPGALSFVPAGMPGAGQLKIAAYDSGDWYTLELVPDGEGTFDVTEARYETTISGGPEGIAYVPPGSPIFGGTPTVLVSEFDEGTISAFDVDANGNPIPETWREFLTGVVDGAWGALVDPLTGDLLFTSTPDLGLFPGDGKVFVIRGFAVPVPEPSSAGLAGLALVLICLASARRAYGSCLGEKTSRTGRTLTT